MLEKMVARDGVEPPTPAFSGLVNLKLQQLTGLRETAKCLQNTRKPDQSWAGIMG